MRSTLTGTAVWSCDGVGRAEDGHRERDINLSAALERALEDALRQDRRTRWLADNSQRIAAYNEQVEVHGAFADTLRSF